MKKTYEKPIAEKIEFKYRDQVVVASSCLSVWMNQGPNSCETGNKHLEYLK